MSFSLRALFFALGIVACGGEKKEAKDPSDKPVPEETPKWEGADRTPPEDKPKAGAPRVNEPPKQRSDQYDKEATNVALKRAARQVKDNCGATKDENGKATGPWGKLTVQVQLGHNGHSQGTTVPPPYAGKPVGNCIERAFKNLTFPPWQGADTQVDWEVELVEPGKK